MFNDRVKIIHNFVSEEDCVKACNLLDEFDRTRRLEVFNGNEDVMVIPESDPECIEFVKKYSDLLLEEQRKFHGFLPDLYTVEGWMSLWLKHRAKSMAHTDSHDGYEHLIFSSVLYLNDDYQGGQIYFPNQGFYYTPRRGDAIMFTCGGHEYLHGVKHVVGRRYTVPMFHSARPDMASKYLHPGVAEASEKHPTDWYDDGWGITDHLEDMIEIDPLF